MILSTIQVLLTPLTKGRKNFYPGSEGAGGGINMYFTILCLFTVNGPI